MYCFKCRSIYKNISVKLLSLILVPLLLFSNLSTANANELLSSDNQLIITAQPENAVCEIGKEFTFSVIAAGEGITYQWQYSDNNGKTWSDSRSKGRAKDTLYLTATDYVTRCIYRCVLTDRNGNTKVTDTVCNSLPARTLEIVSQPENAVCEIGKEFTFSVKAAGEGITYQWQYSDNNGKTWSDSRSKGRTKDTLYLTATDYVSRCIYRCVLTDKNSNTVYTDNVSVIKAEDAAPLRITIQPSDFEADTGDKALFSLKAEGKVLTYNWQYSANGGSSWTDSKYMPSDIIGAHSDTLTVPVTAYRKSACIYRCVVTDSYGNCEISNIVRIVDIENIQYNKGINLFSDDRQVYDVEQAQELLKDRDYFKSDFVLSSDNMILSCPLNLTVNTDDVLILCFTAYADEECSKFTFKLSGNVSYSGTYAVNTYRTAYYLPVTGIRTLSSLQIKLTEAAAQSVHIGNMELYNCAQAQVNNLKTGMFMLDNTSETVYYEDSSIAPKTTSMISDGKYLYTMHYGCLKIYSIEQPDVPVVVSELNGLGNTRDMDFCNNGKGLVITSRENGVYFVDISDVSLPKTVSHYTTMELATGLCVSGDFAFICSRYYGVEVLDISDLSNPKLCSVISDSKEFYDCEIHGEYLYISSWAEKRVEIYSVKDAARPYYVNSILVNGLAGGLDVQNGLLFVATGYNSRDNSSAITSAGYGMGNGMEIYDISNPNSPKWLSTSNIDGRYRNGSYDHWRVKVSGNYAFYNSTYNGIYIYDISNPKAPKRIEHLTIRIPNTSSNYHKNTNSNYVFPYDVSAFQQGPIMSLTSVDGCLYFADVFTGVYSYSADWIKQCDMPDSGSLTCSDREYADSPQISGYTSSVYHFSESVFCAVMYECAQSKLYFAACGDEGIAVLDSNFNVIDRIKTAGSAVDLKIFDDYLITAESNAGLGIYRIENSSLNEISHLKSDESNFTLTDFEINADSTRVIAQVGWTRFAVIDISNPKYPAFITFYKSGTMYNRNLCTGLVSGKYIGVADSGNINWFDSSGSNITKVNTLTNRFASQPNGVTACGDFALAIFNTGYVYYNPAQATQADINCLQMKRIDGAKTLKGKPVSDGKILVVSFGYGKTITIADVSDIDNPVLISQCEVDGYPDVASICDDMIIIPLRSGGMLVFEKDNIQ